MKFCIGIVLYNPSTDDLKRLERYVSCSFFDDVLVYDNSSETHIFQMPRSVKYTFYNKNNGLSIPYNQMLDYCVAHQYDYLCIMDQDSNYPLEEMKKLIDFINTHPQDLVNTGIIAPRVYVRDSQKRVARGEKLMPVKFTLNSGSFLNVALIAEKKLRYDETIFLEGVDVDFCWSIRDAHCLIQIYENSVYTQTLGYALKSSRNRGRVSWRYYYLVHNRKYLMRKHLGYCRGTILSFIKTMSTCLKIMQYEDDKLSKVSNCFKGMCK